jgi:hypothetical protein
LTQRRREVSDSDSAPIRCSPNLIREIGEKVEITEPDEPWAANEPLCIYMISKGFYAPLWRSLAESNRSLHRERVAS